MKNKLILPFLIVILNAQTIKPRAIKARDSISHSRGGHHNSKDTVLLSTIEASSEISVQITSAVSLEASTEATSGTPHQRSRNYSELEFLNNNRFKITEDISTGGGEHLLALMSIMHLKKDSATLSKIQSNFENLLALDDEAFLSELREISS
jgi:hypothetical protein